MVSRLLRTDMWQVKSRQLAEVSRSLTYAMGVDEVMDFTVRRAASILDSDQAVLLTSDAQGSMKVRASVGIPADLAERFEVPLEAAPGPPFEALFDGANQSFMGVPLVVSGRINGVLAVARAGDSLSQEEQEFLLSALADQAAVAIEQVQLGETAQFRERLIGIVSHDLRTPICAISLVAAGLRRKKGDDPQVVAAIDKIEYSAQRATRMIRDLLDYTQLHLGAGVQLKRKPVELREVVARCLEEIGQIFPERPIAFALHGSPSGFWDSDRLEQVVGNLLANALAYGPKDSTIRVQVSEQKAHALLQIHNQGPPIPPERLSSIFEPMQRGDFVANASRSVGLGLYIAKNIVEAHFGTIAVSSSAEAGTRVTVTLPRSHLP